MGAGSEIAGAGLVEAEGLAGEQALEYARDLRRLFGEERVRRLELERAKRRLEDEARHRADFVALLAHELRGPVTTMVGYLELLTGGSLGPLEPDQRSVIDTLARRADDLAILVAELGENAVLSTETTATRTGPSGELPTYLERTLTRIRSRAEDRAIELRVTISIARAEAEVDLGLVGLVVAQLADNAVECGHPGGWAHVSLDQTADFLRLVVEDNGPSFPKELRDSLLGDPSADLSGRLRGDCGLGLAIVAHAARTLRAQVSLDSRNEKGARIRMIVPLSRAA